MKKSVKYFLIASLLLFSFIFASFRFLEYRMINRIPTVLDTLNTPWVAITSNGVTRADCVFQACVRLKGLTLYRSGHQAISLGDLYIRVPPAWPPRLTLTTITSDSPIRLDADLFSKSIRIRSLQGRLDMLTFHVSGEIDTAHETGQLSAQTIGLKSFIRPFIKPEIMTFLNFVISDAPQTLLLKPRNGHLTLQGIPIIPLP